MKGLSLPASYLERHAEAPFERGALALARRLLGYAERGLRDAGCATRGLALEHVGGGEAPPAAPQIRPLESASANPHTPGTESGLAISSPQPASRGAEREPRGTASRRARRAARASGRASRHRGWR